MTEYVYACNAVCVEAGLAIGNALAAAIDPDTGGAETFTKGLRCYPAGTTFTGTIPNRAASNPVAARASFPLLKATGFALVSEFNGSAPWPQLNAIGFNDAQIAAAKTVITLECGPRATIEPHGVEFVQSLGYLV
jgi:hypothetical protein